MAPITGFLLSKMRSESTPPPSRRASVEVLPSRSSRASSLNVSPPAPRSAPAQKPRPAPVTMTARTASSASARSNASIISFIIMPVNALRRSGRLRVRIAAGPSTSYRISLNDIGPPP